MTYSVVYLIPWTMCKSQSEYIIFCADAYFVSSGWLCTGCVLFKKDNPRGGTCL